jgi:hypothetical protein
MTFIVFGRPQVEAAALVGTFTGHCPIAAAAARTTPAENTTEVA